MLPASSAPVISLLPLEIFSISSADWFCCLFVIFAAFKALPPGKIEVIQLTFDNKNESDKKAYFEMTHTTVVRVDESAVNKYELKKIFLSDVPTEIYPEIEKEFFEIVKTIGYPNIKLGKKINFKEMFEKNQ